MKIIKWVSGGAVLSLLLAVAFLLYKPGLSSPAPLSLAVVVPHHDIVKAQRLVFWDELAKKADLHSVELVILVGPDHFGQNQQVITYDDSDWITADGVLQNAHKVPSNEATYSKNTSLVKSDHAVVNLAGEIKRTFPNALFSPFLVGQHVTFAQLRTLQDLIATSCGKASCVLVASVDFSHYVKESQATEQDNRTIQLLAEKTLTEGALNHGTAIEADSPQSLYLLQEFARENQLTWWLQNRTNSAFGNPDTTDTTSHVFGGYLKQ